MSNCEFDAPDNCSSTSDLNIQSIIGQAHDTYVAEELSNCSNFTARAGYPGVNGAAAGDFYCKEPNITLFRQGENQTLDFYVAWNIYNFATWSFSYYTAMQYAYSYTTAFIWNDTLAFGQIKGSFPLGEEIMLGFLTFALGLFSPSGWGKELPGKGGANAVQNAVEGAAGEAETASRLSAWILQKIF